MAMGKGPPLADVPVGKRWFKALKALQVLQINCNFSPAITSFRNRIEQKAQSTRKWLGFFFCPDDQFVKALDLPRLLADVYESPASCKGCDLAHGCPRLPTGPSAAQRGKIK